MRKYILLVAILLLSLYACTKSTEMHDSQSPTVSDVRVNYMDTLILVITNPDPNAPIPEETVYIYLNSHDGTSKLDTVILGTRFALSAQFEDDQSLSSYRVLLDTMPTNLGVAGDTVFSRMGTGSVFGVKDSILHKRKLFDTPDSITVTVNKETIKRPVRDGEYLMSLSCIDRAGNETTVKKVIYMIHKDDYERVIGIRP